MELSHKIIPKVSQSLKTHIAGLMRVASILNQKSKRVLILQVIVGTPTSCQKWITKMFLSTREMAKKTCLTSSTPTSFRRESKLLITATYAPPPSNWAKRGSSASPVARVAAICALRM